MWKDDKEIDNNLVNVLYSAVQYSRVLAKARYRGVKPANKVGAVNYVKMYRVYDHIYYALATCLQ